MKKLLFSYLMNKFVSGRSSYGSGRVDRRKLKKYLLIGGVVVAAGGVLFIGLAIWLVLAILPSGEQLAGLAQSAKSQVATISTSVNERIQESERASKPTSELPTAAAAATGTDQITETQASSGSVSVKELEQKAQGLLGEAKQSPLLASLIAYFSPFLQEAKNEIAPYAGIAKGAMEELKRQSAKSDAAPEPSSKDSESNKEGSSGSF